MKTKFWCTLSALLLNLCSFGQTPITNGSFENWTVNLPDHWKTSNFANGQTNNVTRFRPAYEGEYAVKGEVMVYPYTPGFPLIPLLESKTEDGIFQISELPPAMNMYYQFHPAAFGDILKVFVSVQGEGGTFLGSGFAEIARPASEFTLLSIPLNYYIELQPVRIFVSMTIDHNGPNELPTVGSYFIVDEITVGDVISSVDDPLLPRTEVGNVYPNPGESEMYLPILLSRSQKVQLELFDASGHKVSNGYSGMLDRGEHVLPVDTSQLPNGLYLCRLSTFGGSMTRKIQVARK